MLIDIIDPDENINNSVDTNDTVIGIDLGTTNSLVSIVEDSQPKIIGEILPSIVSYAQDGSIYVGYETAGATNIKSIKRLMGKGKKDIKKISNILPYNIVKTEEDELIKLNIENRQLNPIEISAEILKQLKSNAEDYLGQQVKRAVITVPAYFDAGARQATKDAAKLAGLDVLRLINEPTAAAVAYGLEDALPGIYVIYDLGGGTFDVSVLNLAEGVFQVLATAGDNELGGDDVDNLIALKIIEDLNLTVTNEHDLNQIKEIAKHLKEQLSTNNEMIEELYYRDKKYSIKLNTKEFERLTKPLIQRTVNILQTAIREAEVEPREIKEIVLVGGSTRIPYIRDSIKEQIGITPLSTIDPDRIVAFGAAVQAHGLSKGGNNLLVDVVPLSLGLEIMGGMVEKIINKNTPIPTTVSKLFTTHKDGQTAMKIHVLQGEREMVEDCRSLASFELRNIPPLKAAVPRVRVTFNIDADGLLTVLAEEESTHTKQEIEVKPTYGLSEEEIEGMLIDSYKNAELDHNKKLLAQTIFEAEVVIDAFLQLLEEEEDLFKDEEIEEIKNQIRRLKQSISSQDKAAIEHDLQNLEQLSSEFATKKIDKYIGSALKGKSLNEIEKTFLAEE